MWEFFLSAWFFLHNSQIGGGVFMICDLMFVRKKLWRKINKKTAKMAFLPENAYLRTTFWANAAFMRELPVRWTQYAGSASAPSASEACKGATRSRRRGTRPNNVF